MQTFRVTTFKINKHRGLSHHNYFLQMPNQCKKFLKYTTYKAFFFFFFLFSVQTDVESLKRGMEIQQINP